ncbi:Sugar isomerase, KpsF/GutQ family [Laribacter hongkongensis HLHK9]|uniref:Sugar isomerase, KpsF/GutQ family n=1 Tax=Laribacter hongkongensis (strain HLHK9) TaxID=557598 RepID=C1D963_LARHH|nr:Sugar isomerase, KpsF/GutQ family [Laribacter hongkongensis HLHK9]
MKSPFIISMNANLSAHRLALARDVLSTEAQAIESLSSRLDETFLAAVDAMLATTGRVVVTGMGKSGHVARKIAATLASTGTPAFFVHPAEAAHGDLGMILSGDVVLALSNSGESDEVIALLPAMRRKQVTLIAMTGRTGSTLAREADIHLDAAVEREACPLGLAPTSSTTAALALGDALAVTLLDARNFRAEDFAMSHPAGSLGRRLLVRGCRRDAQWRRPASRPARSQPARCPDGNQPQGTGADGGCRYRWPAPGHFH